MDDKIVKVPASEIGIVSDIEIYQQENEVEETVKEIKTEASEEHVIKVNEVTGFVSGVCGITSDKHEISEIRNLDAKLETLGAPHETYSQKGGYAEFREWRRDADSNYIKNKITEDGEIGYFVSLVDSDNTRTAGGNIYIDICDGSYMDAYGVTVGDSAFCGYQYPNYNVLGEYKTDPKDKSDGNNSFAKVCLLGEVMVRVHADTNVKNISVGSYVVPDKYGCAAPSDNTGYKVIATSGPSGVGDSAYKYGYVVISLVPQNDSVSRVIKELESTKSQIGNISLQIGKLESDIGGISGIGSVLEGFEEEFDNLKTTVNDKLNATGKALDRAQQVSNDAKAAIESMNTKYVEALAKAEVAKTNANSALSNVDKMSQDLNDLLNWEKDGAKGVQGFVNEMGMLGTLQQQINNNQADISAITQIMGKDGAAIQLLVARADLYSVGEYSPSYGLSYDEAKGVLREGDFIYVCVDNNGHIEASSVYYSTDNCSINEGDPGCFEIGGALFEFKAPYALGNFDTYEYHSRTKKLIINKGTDLEKECIVKKAGEINGPKLTFKPEYSVTFENYGVYRWTETDMDNHIYEWVEATDILIDWSPEPPNADDTECMLWYCENGASDDSQKLEYLPGTLYLLDDGRWIAVATVNDSNARSVSLLNQTADSLTSTITDVQGNVSEIQQTVDGVTSTVSNVKEQLSTVTQKADEIAAGVYNGTGDAAQLAIALNKISSTASSNFNMPVGELLGQPVLPEGYNKYSLPPIWNGDEFVFSGGPAEDGKYCLNPDNSEQYYRLYDDKYEIYTSGTQTITSLQQQVNKNSAAIESFTEFDAANNKTLTQIFQESDADRAEIGATVMGEFRKRTEINLNITEEEKLLIEDRYSTAPVWEDNKFVFEGQTSSDGAYCIPTNSNSLYYWKLLLDGKNVIGYEQYEIHSEGYAAIVAKTVKDGESTSSSIGLVAGNDNNIGGLFVNAINDKSEVLIDADKIGINGVAVFKNNLTGKTTSINGDLINTGVLTSNNYAGPRTYVMYGAKLGSTTITKGTQLTDHIYYALLVTNYSLSSSIINQKYYYVEEIKDGVELYITKQDNSQYVVSASDFDLISSSTSVSGMKIDLNNGTIYSDKLKLNRDGTLTVTGEIRATSGYIGDGSNGFTITNTAIYNGQTGYSGGGTGVYIGTDGIGLGGGNFYVTNSGSVTIKSGTLSSPTITSGNISSTSISGSTITGSTIEGGKFYSTGSSDGDSAYYIYYDDKDDNNNNNVKGCIRYDTNGLNIKDPNDGLQYADNKYRVIFKTEDGVAMKLYSGGNMSLCAGSTITPSTGIGNGTIYFMSKVHFAGDVTGNISKIAVFG